MPRQNTRNPRDILYQEEYLVGLDDISEYLAVKNPDRHKRKNLRDEKLQKKKGSYRPREMDTADLYDLPLPKKVKGILPDSGLDRF